MLKKISLNQFTIWSKNNYFINYQIKELFSFFLLNSTAAKIINKPVEKKK